jgi:hypothetical protein
MARLIYPEISMRARGLLLALLGVAALAWAVVAARPSPPPVALPPPRAAAVAPVVREISDLDRASVRLQSARGVNGAALAAPTRNPFEFEAVRPRASAAPKRTDATAALAALAPMLLPPALPQVTLVGLVDRQVDGRMVRTAVLSFGGRLHYVEAGSRLGAAYEVVAVEGNAVDLLALDTNTPRRLVQR